MLLITGEEIVGLQSTLARILVLEFCESDIDMSKLSALQARAHQLPHAMSSYIGWLRENITDMQHLFPDKFREYRTRATKEDGHKKMAEQVAFLQFSIDTMLQWVMDRGDISESRAKELSLEAWSIFIELSKKQQTRISDEDPIKRFNAILEALISQGAVTIYDKNSCKPALGGNSANSDLIWYFDDLNWYLLLVPLWHNVQRYCLSEGTHFPLTKDTFYNMLEKRGLIELGPSGRRTVAIRIGAGQKRVLKFIGWGMSETGVIDEE
jgi:hypothetical protein